MENIMENGFVMFFRRGSRVTSIMGLNTVYIYIENGSMVAAHSLKNKEKLRFQVSNKGKHIRGVRTQNGLVQHARCGGW